MLIPQRLGAETAVIPRDVRLLDRLDVLLVLNPEDGALDPDGEWIRGVKTWVRDGGCLIVTTLREHFGHGERTLAYFDAVDLQPQNDLHSEVHIRMGKRGSGKVIQMVGSEWLDLDGLGRG